VNGKGGFEVLNDLNANRAGHALDLQLSSRPVTTTPLNFAPKAAINPAPNAGFNPANTNVAHSITPSKKPIGELTNHEFVQDIATRAEKKIGGSGAVSGTKKHTYAKQLGERAQRRFGDRGLEFEKEYKGGEQLNKGDSRKGSTRLDVYDKQNKVVYDYKFVQNPGNGLKSGQIRKIQEQGPKDAKIIEINPVKKDK
jgi:hypothetical protein